MVNVFLGIGHGGTDTGAIANGFKEKDLNLSIGIACRDVLERHGVNVLMSRNRDENDALSDVIRECNVFNPELAVDIHNNAGGADGAEVFHTIGGGVGKTLAQNVNNEIVKIGQNSRGVKTRVNKNGGDYYGFIRQTKAPAIIVECAFMDNKNDIAIIDTEAERKRMGAAIAKGILKTLGIAYVEEQQARATDNTPDSYAANAINWAKDCGILYGDGNGDLKLHSNVTRQDVIVFLYRALNK